MKCIILGSTGLLGEAFCRLFSPSFSVQSLGRTELDLLNPSAIPKVLQEHDFDLIINAAGMTGLEQCLDAPEQAMTVNAESPQILAQCCSEKGARLVHFSTDYVFGGEKEGLLEANDPAEPISMYGQTKLAGEVAVLEAGDHLVCRVSWLFGPARNSVLDQVVEQAQQAKKLCYIKDKWSIPTFVDDIVRATQMLLERRASGIFHLCSDNEPVSWHEYAVETLKIAKQLGLIESLPEVEQGSLAEVAAFRAKRPKHTAMSIAKLNSLGIEMPDWRESAEVYLKKWRS